MGSKARPWVRLHNRRWPTRVKLKGLWWDIHYVPEDHAVLREHCPAGRDLMGCCIEWDMSIYVANTLAYEKMRDTLRHELAHACYRTAGGLPQSESGEEHVVLFTTETSIIINDVLKEFDL